MKHIVLILFLALGYTFSVEAQSDRPYTIESFDRDTLTDTALDTITLTNNLVSNWSYCWQVDVTRVSGTGNPILIVQESAGRTGDDWIEVGRDTITATGVYRITGDRVYGLRQRLIRDGEGTAVHDFETIRFVGKKD